jgi:uncharacterized ferredoxin-like protein
VAAIDMPAKLEGNSLSAVFAPKPEVIRKAQASKVAAAKLAPKVEKKEDVEMASVEDDDGAEAENE